MSDGAAELLLVAGYAGVGKSALVNEIHKAIARRGGTSSSGKFDQLERNAPRTPRSRRRSASSCSYIVAERAESLARWRTALLGSARGRTAQLIVDLVPELELVIGPQPAVARSARCEAQNRFHLVFQSFVRVIARDSARSSCSSTISSGRAPRR